MTASLPFAAQSHANIFDIFGGGDEEKASEEVIFARTPLTASKSTMGTNLELTPEIKVLSYNNFYEFGTGKGDPVRNSQSFSVNPWTLEVTGLVNKPLKLGYEDLIKRFPLEDRYYRMRCVEAWSMNIPWLVFRLLHCSKRRIHSAALNTLHLKHCMTPSRWSANAPGWQVAG